MPPPNKLQPIIVKKIKKGDHDVHSTAWKIALADFMTALMCFFLVMWLTTILNTDTKPDVSRFFNMSGVDESDVGIGGILGGSTITIEGPLSQMAAEFTVVPPMGAVDKNESQVLGRYLPKTQGQKGAPAALLALEAKKQARMRVIARAIADDLRQHPEIGQYIRMTEDKQYIRIDFLDTYPKPMFAVGSRELLPEAGQVVEHVAKTLSHYAGTTSIEGHTDALAYHDKYYTNWELSSDRANATRRFLGRRVPGLKINAVVGKGAQRLKDQLGVVTSSNRRVSLLFFPDDSLLSQQEGQGVSASPRSQEEEKQDNLEVKSLEELVEGEDSSAEAASNAAQKKAVKYII